MRADVHGSPVAHLSLLPTPTTPDLLAQEIPSDWALASAAAAGAPQAGRAWDPDGV